MPVWSAGISGIGFSLASLVLLLPVVYLTTGSQFYQSHAYGDEAAWTPADYLHVMKYCLNLQIQTSKKCCKGTLQSK